MASRSAPSTEKAQAMACLTQAKGGLTMVLVHLNRYASIRHPNAQRVSATMLEPYKVTPAWLSKNPDTTYPHTSTQIKEREYAGVTEGLWQAQEHLARLAPYLKKTNQCPSLRSAPRMLLRLVDKAEYALAASEQLSSKDYKEAESNIRVGRLNTPATLEQSRKPQSRKSPWTPPSVNFVQILTVCPVYALVKDVPTIKKFIKDIDDLNQLLRRKSASGE